MRLLKKKFILVAVIVLILLGLIVAGLAVPRNRKNASAPSYASPVCEDESPKGIMTQAAPVLMPGKTTQLKPLVEKVKAIPNYDQDPNCLAIVVTYYINISDAKNAQLYFDKLDKVYDAKKGFSSILGPYVLRIDTMRADVGFLQKQQDDLKNHVKRVQQPS